MRARAGSSEQGHPLLTGPAAAVAADEPRFPAQGGHEQLRADLQAMGVKHEEAEERYGGGPGCSFGIHLGRGRCRAEGQTSVAA